MMIIHKVKQGSPEWLELRATHDTGSEASAMMGASKKVKRNELLHMKATGTVKEFSDWVQKNLLDRGHEIEAKARPFAEKIIGGSLFPVTGSSDTYERMLVSLDGMTALGTITFECKSWNEEKVASVRLGIVPDEDYWQVAQGLVVSRAEKCLYMVTDGTPEKTVWCWFELGKNDEDRLVRGWAQLNEDLKSYTPPAEVVDVIAAPVADLPAITYAIEHEVDEVTKKVALVVRHNLAPYRERVFARINEAKKELKTDQDFADRKQLNRDLRAQETKIRLVQEMIRGETGDVDRLCRELDEIFQAINQSAIAGEKQVEQREKLIKNEQRDRGINEFKAHVDEINKRLHPVQIPVVVADFQAAIKNKRTIASLVNSVDTELARVKILADEHHDKIAANLATLREKAPEEVRFLFRDVQELVLKDNETLLLIIKSRIDEHAKAEEERLEKIRAEERKKLEDEQAEAALIVTDPVVEVETDPVIHIDPASGPDESVVVEIEQPAQQPLSKRAFWPVSPRTIPAAEATVYEVTDMLALVKAIAAGEAPLRILTVDLEQLALAMNGIDELPAGVTRTGGRAADNEPQECCRECGDVDCNGQCMGDGNMGCSG